MPAYAILCLGGFAGLRPEYAIPKGAWQQGPFSGQEFRECV
jgi:hypothetical protein